MRPALTVTLAHAPYGGAVADLVQDKAASRLAARDPTLWGPDAQAEAAIRLNWVDLAESSRPLLAEVDALRADLWGEGVDRVVLCGMGGSSLAPEVVTATYGVDLVVLDSTAPSVVERALAADLSRTVVVVSSKSGTTLETDSQRRAFQAAFQRSGIDPGEHMVAVTDPGSPLAEQAGAAGYRKIFLADPHVGGRYSALTAFGLVPAGLAGVDVAELLDEADEVSGELASDDPANPALALAALLGAEPARDKLVLADAGSRARGFAEWAEQLVAESTGKQGGGVLPVPVEGPDAPELVSPADDVKVGFLLDPEAADEQGRTALPPTAPGLPVAGVSGPLGAQLLLWETATALAGRLLGINPFDQPDVERAKAAARGLLESRPEPEPAAFTDAAVEVRGTPGLLDGVDRVTDAVQRLLDRLPRHGYVAVMAYLDPERDAVLRRSRAGLARRTGRPVTFGWGPRFLHSTGQYHKGGPPTGVHLQVAATAGTDVDVPGRPFTFGELISAQAAGDARVLAEAGRPVLRLHLTDAGAGVEQLLAALG